MSSRTAAWTLAALLATTGGAFAAAATPDEAATIRTALERYLGQGPVAVAPAGEAYRIDIDLKAALKGLERFGVSLDPVTTSMTATPQGNGTWRVTGGAPPLLTVKAGGRTTSIVANGYAFDDIFDPRIPFLTKSTSHYDSLSLGTVTGDGTGPASVQTRQLTKGEQSATATVVGDGIVDIAGTQTNAAYAQDIAIDAAAGGRHIAFKGGASTDGLTVKALSARALMDLWAFLVAHPTPDALKAASADLKSKLRQALPVFADLTQDGTLANLAVESPIGPIAAHSLTTHVALAGLTQAGSATLGLKAEGLALPTASLPAWTAVLIPTTLDLQDTVSGFRLDQAARTAIDLMEPGAPQLLSPENLDKVRTALGSRDTLVVTLGENHIVTPTLDAHVSGSVRLAGPVPSLAVTLRASGLDAAIAAVRAKGAKDSTAIQAITMLTLVKGYGKAETDGTMSWAMMGDGTGAVTVNGVPLPIGIPK
ncbi:hypothetical protein P7D22_10805 [Lichenihabitans sp. Uapishka_5]|uniref:hypothetical protein n=1 Tax=Lichenihabitans sp. Uapishka_5 TaxID=3037302 RepID=UPI0029E8005B|nr:hypothetical protein [Lichenihabitans sp. Uapishka_5]MDX7951657.1 hypothetical protein [Lichenihabitans sp. Uapishka_5]